MRETPCPLISSPDHPLKMPVAVEAEEGMAAVDQTSSNNSQIMITVSPRPLDQDQLQRSAAGYGPAPAGGDTKGGGW